MRIENSRIIIEGTTFEGNKASYGGSIYVVKQSILTIRDCEFIKN